MDGDGHFVILRASWGDDLQDKLFSEMGGVTSAQTLAFHSREAASCPAVPDIVRRADANVIRVWPSATRRVRPWVVRGAASRLRLYCIGQTGT